MMKCMGYSGTMLCHVAAAVVMLIKDEDSDVEDVVSSEASESSRYESMTLLPPGKVTMSSIITCATSLLPH